MLQKVLAVLLLGGLLLSGCGTGPVPAEAPPPAETSPASAPALEPEPELPTEADPVPEDPAPPEPLGIGEAAFADPGELTLGQQTVILDLITRLYDSLALLEVREIADLFAPEGEGQLWGNRAVWEYSIQVRRLQRADLSLTGWASELSVQEVEEQEDGTLRVQVAEDSVQNFRATPGVDSRQLGVRHQFTLTPAEGEDRWLLVGHGQWDTLYWTVMGRSAWGSSGGGTERYYASRLAQLLNTAREDINGRLTQGTEQELSAQNPYDREAAVAYARRWVGVRNPDWPDYSRNGGNCQNFVSQCLLAGGIPMDVRSPGIWKWYGSTPNNLAQVAGRSGSWSSVGDFHDYAAGNTGYGLSAAVDAPYYSGSPGDVIHLGTGDRWRHTVLITQTVQDDSGETIDYLICSNTADLLNFPVGAYSYTRQMLIRIVGWDR